MSCMLAYRAFLISVFECRWWALKKLGSRSIFLSIFLHGAPKIRLWARSYTDPVAVVFWAIATKFTWSFFGLRDMFT